MLQPSKWYAALLTAVHLFVLLILYISPLYNTLLSLSLGLAVGVSGIRSIRRQALLVDAQSIVQVAFDRDEYRLLCGSGRLIDATLVSPVICGNFFIVLWFRSSRQSHCVVLAPDSLQRATLRRARVFLSWGAS